jgi:transcriptional regulator with XRE-family HTH domain
MGEIMRHLIEKELERTSQSSLAREIGISQATIHKILYTDTVMTVPTLRKLARHFKVPLTRLLAETPVEAASAEAEAEYVALTKEEEKLLDWYRYLCRAGKGNEIIQFAEYLVEREQNARHTRNRPGKGASNTR